MIINPDLYQQIVRQMPIPCVDLLVQDDQKRILLVKRANEPARGQWWFPGGRIHFMESRQQAVVRKLLEECDLQASQIIEMGTFDVILQIPDGYSHGITTLFHVLVNKQNEFTLDAQGVEANWRSPSEWLKEELHEFVEQGIQALPRN